jgi:hypothetical protein
MAQYLSILTRNNPSTIAKIRKEEDNKWNKKSNAYRRAKGTAMRNQFNQVIFGIFNQPQIWIKHTGEKITTVLNYVLFGVVNQPQLWIERTGDNMETEIIPTEEECEDGDKVNVRVQGGSSGAVYGLGIIGAAIYYISRAITPQEKAIGFLKALVWPVFLVKGVLELLDKED